MCAKPRAPPPPSARPIVGRPGSGAWQLVPACALPPDNNSDSRSGPAQDKAATILEKGNLQNFFAPCQDSWTKLLREHQAGVKSNRLRLPTAEDAYRRWSRFFNTMLILGFPWIRYIPFWRMIHRFGGRGRPLYYLIFNTMCRKDSMASSFEHAKKYCGLLNPVEPDTIDPGLFGRGG